MHVKLQPSITLMKIDIAQKEDCCHNLKHIHAMDTQDDQVGFPSIEPLNVFSFVRSCVSSI